MSVLEDFKLVERVSDDILEEYRAKLPEEMINFWTKYGFGIFMGGYFKSVNPAEYKDILESTSERYTDGIVLFATGMGDLIIWSDGYVRLLNYRYGMVKTIFFSFEFFFEDTADEEFRIADLMWNPYQEAVKKTRNSRLRRMLWLCSNSSSGWFRENRELAKSEAKRAYPINFSLGRGY